MNREEILEKSRKEKHDEGFVAAENKGRKIGISAFCCVLVFIITFNYFNEVPYHEAMALFWAFTAAEAYPKYKFTSNANYLLLVIAGAISCVVFLACHVLAVLG